MSITIKKDDNLNSLLNSLSNLLFSLWNKLFWILMFQNNLDYNDIYYQLLFHN